MTLRRTLGLALARQTRPSITRGQRLRVIWFPQNFTNTRPYYRFLDPAGTNTLTRPYSQSRSPMSSQSSVTAAQAEKQTTQLDNIEEPEVEEEEEEEEDPDSDPHPPVVEKWNEAVDAVLAATRTAFPGSPAFNAASPGTFQSYWRGVFARLHTQVTSDSHIPEYLTSPPCKEFVVNVFAQGGANNQGYSCPCCLPWVEPSVRLENEAGVTKGDLVRGLGEFLYGEGLPRVYVEDEEGNDVIPEDEEEREKRTGVLVHGVDWMSEGGTGGGGWIGRPAMIWMYCCRPDEFAEKTATKLRDEAGTTIAKL
ncbi:hypothetical protein DHEL01_v202234 [Diaporthe helianthi]|uniref:Uncharacterized protein n=1 Tax=Diaporthe helianthi TaxID=158607 RepID=A0A2P5IAA4_DIAHE|nr:hypothetical protein DHEL01_v202234 [Diaporthe helianthi]